jgi:hypothetical protein
MKGKGQLNRIALAIALALASAAAGAKAVATDAIIGGDNKGSKRQHAIIGGDTDAIIGGDVNAIIGGDVDAIIGGDVNAIIGGDPRKARANAIIGGDVDAIIGGDVNAIIGGDLNAIIGGDVLRSLVAVGPLSSVDPVSGQVTVLGQKYKGPASSPTLKAWAEALTAGSQTYIAIIGQPGNLNAKTMIKLPANYIAGSSQVVLRGKIINVDERFAQIRIGNQLVDYSATLSSDGSALKSGMTVLVLGTQPTLNGIVVAQ